MNWKIVLTNEASEDLLNIYYYIALNLLAPQTAKGQIDRIIEEIEGLKNMPHKFPCYDKETKGENLRKLTVDNYIVFYNVSEEQKEVQVLRVLYSGRDITKILK